MINDAWMSSEMGPKILQAIQNFLIDLLKLNVFCYIFINREITVILPSAYKVQLKAQQNTVCCDVIEATQRTLTQKLFMQQYRLIEWKPYWS